MEQLARLSRTLLTILATSMVLWPLSATADDNGALWLEQNTDQGALSVRPSPYAQLVKQVGPAVVSIRVSFDRGEIPAHARRAMPNPFEAVAEGSGFVIHPDGYLLTNYHVVENARQVTVQFDDRTTYDAQVIGGDPMTDLALLKVTSPQPLPAIPLGDSAQSEVGDYVVAIGNPLGLSHSVTAGIISALDRRDLPIEGTTHQTNFIQIDAPINPGNSGGPLLNMRGEVIGINTAVNRQGQGISFAIPINLVKALLPQLHQRGHIVRSHLGVRIQPMDSLLARSFGLETPRGALVTEVLDGSPAASAGIEKRDIVITFNGIPVERSDQLPLMVATTPPDQNVTIRLLRDGQEIDLPVGLQAVPDQTPPDLPTGTSPPPPAEGSGVEVTAMTDRLARQLNAPQDRGVVVTSLAENSAARKAGLRNRDVILEVDSTAIDSIEAFDDAFENARGQEVIRLKVLRSGRSVYLAFTP